MPASSLRQHAYLVAAILLITSLASCGDSDDSPSSTAPSGRSAVISIENFTASATPVAGGAFTYRASLTLRESGGVGATITGVTLTLTQMSGATTSTDVSPAEAFATTRIGTNSTLPTQITFTGPPVSASQLSVRIAFRDDNAQTGTVQASTNVIGG